MEQDVAKKWMMVRRIRPLFDPVGECCCMGVSLDVDGSGLNVSNPSCGYVPVDLLSILTLGCLFLPIYPIQLVVPKTR